MEELEKQVKELTASVTGLQSDLKKEQDARETDKKDFEKQLAEKDVLIQQKTDDVVQARKKYKKLSELTDEEKEALSEKEKEIMERQEQQEADAEAFRKEQQEKAANEAKERREAAIKKYAGDNEEIAKKIGDNFDRIKGSEEAQTEGEIATLVGDAYNMLGQPDKEVVADVVSAAGDGQAPGEGKKTEFADSERGKAASKALGLENEQDDNPDTK